MKRKCPCRHNAEETVADQVLIAIHSCAQRLHTLAWFCDAVAPTITEFVADLQSGHSTFDMPPEELREASLAGRTHGHRRAARLVDRGGARADLRARRAVLHPRGRPGAASAQHGTQ